MAKDKITIAGKKLNLQDSKVTGEFVTLKKERYFKIENYRDMPPFLMSIVSNSNHWMFISSQGGLTAGRTNPDQAIFPYYTDDKIHEAKDLYGDKSILRIRKNNSVQLWEPFSDYYKGIYNTTNKLYKNTIGNKLIFEEINHDLKIKFRIAWMNSDKYGWIRQTYIKNLSGSKKKIELLDGIHNIIPSGILKTVQETFSTLMDAYKKSELEKSSQLGIFCLSSIPVDRAEPSEALKSTTVWNTAENVNNILLSKLQLDSFRKNGNVKTEYEKKGIRGAYLIIKKLVLKPSETDSFLIISDVNQDSAAVLNLSKGIVEKKHLEQKILLDVKKGTQELEAMVLKADGIQYCGDERVMARHFSNVLFNIMRGGIYENGYNLSKNDLKNHFRKFNKEKENKYSDWFKKLEDSIDYITLLEKASKIKDEDFQRLILEFLPLTFSRRHGDPSRPWNRFSIDVKNPDGSKSLSYEGNWRDIFQNWEALSYSYPHFLESIITKFLNASTIDGYNPYRITNEGVDWETFDPSDPWSFIGYWGDHQIIYLLKLLEQYEKFFPGRLAKKLDNRIYTFVNVPYRINSYKKIVSDPNHTIVFDEDLHKTLMENAAKLGADGKLLTDSMGTVFHVNLLEKLLIPLLTKLSNLIPGAGIWINTQRPEWNDANNALVGNGVSMVTLYYMRRYIQFLHNVMDRSKRKIPLSENTTLLLDDLQGTFQEYENLLDNPMSNTIQRTITNKLGTAGSKYRTKVYNKTNSASSSFTLSDINKFLTLALKYIDASIAQNKRSDKLYHAYNLIEIGTRTLDVNRLPVMLEGQVAFLSSGYAKPDEVLDLLEALRGSTLYRKDQDSYILYPDKKVSKFTEKNNIPEELTERNTVLSKITDLGGSEIIVKDNSGGLHFNSDFKNAGILKDRIIQLNKRGKTNLSKEEIQVLLEIYESMFKHAEFTGRSGSFFKYEGLGSIYWHMISKLLLAVSENIQWFTNTNEDKDKIDQLKTYYKAIREGIGIHKNPKAYGAFPTDPYSHTPAMLGAQQPGMTGQVKEDIISRWFELGISISEGKIRISTENIDKNELDAKGELSFTFCGTPFKYFPGESAKIFFKLSDGNEEIIEECELGPSKSEEIFARTGLVKEVKVMYKK